MDWPDGARCAVSISFDDARTSQVDNGLPVLDANGVRGTFYVSLGKLEKRLDAWKAAIRSGHEIGNHTVDHPCSGNYRFKQSHLNEDYTLEDIERDILEANERLKETLGITPTTFAYPCGNITVGRGETSQSYVPVIARHFLAGRSFYEQRGNDPARCDLARLHGTPLDNLSLDDAIAAVEDAAKEGAWLAFVAHDVADEGKQAIAPDVLDALCRYCRAPENGIWIDRIDVIARYVRDAQKAQLHMQHQ